MEIGTDMLRLPAVGKGAAKARQDARSPRNRGSAAKVGLRSEKEGLEHGSGRCPGEVVRKEPPSPLDQLLVASASHRRAAQRAVRVLRSPKMRGWIKR